MIHWILLMCLAMAMAELTYSNLYANTYISYQTVPSGLLYPRESETREVKSLDGLWDFAVESSDLLSKRFDETWFKNRLSKSAQVMQMPVPSSYNDITTSKVLRDHVGVVWYDRDFFIPSSWIDRRVFIRFGSINYLAQVWINGKLVIEHEMGHLPFEVEITFYVEFGARNQVLVSVNNELLHVTIPQGLLNVMPSDNENVLVQSPTFDFFNYAGIHRPVLLSTKPRVYVDDITVNTSISEDIGIIRYAIEPAGLEKNEAPIVTVTLRDENSTLVAKMEGISGALKVPNAKLWWAIGMHPEPGYLYTLEVTLRVENSTEIDICRLPVGIRTIKWTDSSVLLNDKPVYLRGFGRHEDSIIRGRGLDLATMTRDYELLKWVGGNAYRTSNYPYSEEVMDMADRQGFLIIDECPAVHTEDYSATLLTKHKMAVSQLIRRDKNHPSVLMWSIGGAPVTSSYSANYHYDEVASHTRLLDPTRPITAAIATSYFSDKAAQFLDVISFNRYNSWFVNPGRLDMIVNEIIAEAENWRKYGKPVFISEYGADTQEGLHELPEYIWSEEYQTAVLSKHFQAFDRLRQEGWFIGELIWNFADFKTAQSITRVGGNKKGIFTRTRQPKMAAHHVRRRYHSLAWETDGAYPPQDLQYYVIAPTAHDEF